MSHLIRALLVIAGASALVAPRAQTQSNILEIVVVNGPHAGTYKPPASDVMCVHYKQQRVYAATWANIENEAKAVSGSPTQTKNNANEISEGAVNISNPDAPGAKYGELLIAFGMGKKRIRYTVDRAPLKLTIKGRGAEIASQGKTKDGIELRVTARCSKVEQF